MVCQPVHFLAYGRLVRAFYEEVDPEWSVQSLDPYQSVHISIG